jgi:hypothetical protein
MTLQRNNQQVEKELTYIQQSTLSPAQGKTQENDIIIIRRCEDTLFLRGRTEERTFFEGISYMNLLKTAITRFPRGTDFRGNAVGNQCFKNTLKCLSYN